MCLDSAGLQRGFVALDLNPLIASGDAVFIKRDASLREAMQTLADQLSESGVIADGDAALSVLAMRRLPDYVSRRFPKESDSRIPGAPVRSTTTLTSRSRPW